MHSNRTINTRLIKLYVINKSVSLYVLGDVAKWTLKGKHITQPLSIVNLPKGNLRFIANNARGAPYFAITVRNLEAVRIVKPNAIYSKTDLEFHINSSLKSRCFYCKFVFAYLQALYSYCYVRAQYI